MRLLCRFGGISSLALVAVGFFELWNLGPHAPGLSAFIAACGSGFALNLTLYVFHLRDRITALEKQSQALK